MRRGWTATGMAEAMDGGEGDPGGEDDEGEGVDEGGEDSGALVAEGFFGGGGAGLEVDGYEGEQDGEEVGDVVAGLGDEGEGVGAEAEDEGRDDVGRGERHGDLEDALHLAVWGCDHVHNFDFRPTGFGRVWAGGPGFPVLVLCPAGATPSPVSFAQNIRKTGLRSGPRLRCCLKSEGPAVGRTFLLCVLIVSAESSALVT